MRFPCSLESRARREQPRREQPIDPRIPAGGGTRKRQPWQQSRRRQRGGQQTRKGDESARGGASDRAETALTAHRRDLMPVQSRVATGTHQYTQQRRATEKRSASRDQGLCARVCRAVACSVACCAMPRRDRPVVRPLSESVSETRCRRVSESIIGRIFTILFLFRRDNQSSLLEKKARKN